MEGNPRPFTWHKSAEEILDRLARGPGRSRHGLFFNPASAFARDLSVLYLAAHLRPGLRVLDGLTGVGARAVRWQWEVPGDYTIADHTELFSVSRRTVYRTLQRDSRSVDTH